TTAGRTTISRARSCARSSSGWAGSRTTGRPLVACYRYPLAVEYAWVSVRESLVTPRDYDNLGAVLVTCLTDPHHVRTPGGCTSPDFPAPLAERRHPRPGLSRSPRALAARHRCARPDRTAPSARRRAGTLARLPRRGRAGEAVVVPGRLAVRSRR